ncbi:Lacal_2735 family protein [Tenacibaculum amylolyticum]|uniref:Lacal_2735 family protein n=1 Tax=Tenacibaculum amylolyticum TaxID=104269 RepID=UPI003893B2E3
MFSIFKKRSLEDKLQQQYDKLMSERNKLLKNNRKESLVKFNEAQRVLNKIESLRNAF